MSLISRLLVLATLPFLLLALSSAQKISVAQPTLWANQPDVAAFEKSVNDHLAAAQQVSGHPGCSQGPAHHR